MNYYCTKSIKCLKSGRAKTTLPFLLFNKFSNFFTNGSNELIKTKKTLRTQERMKELKHKTACELTRRDFLPFIVSTDGCLGEQAQAFLKRLGRKLADKWQRAYSQVMGFIKARMAIAILRASSQCLRGPRKSIQSLGCIMEDGAALGVAQL